jgi:subtilisin family serine protease
VGSLASSPASSTLDQRASYSETGPGVDIWAPGTDIISCTSNTVDTNRFSPTDYAEYYLDPEYLQMNISGTSMAAPQVAGVAALVLSANPGLTPAVLKSFLVLNSGSAIFTTGVDNDYTNIQTLAGGAQRVLFNKFNQDVALRHSGGIIKR